MKRIALDENSSAHSYFHITCPECKASNWIYSHDHADDLTCGKLDPEGFFCHSCKSAVFWDEATLETHSRHRDYDLRYLLNEGEAASKLK